MSLRQFCPEMDDESSRTMNHQNLELTGDLPGYAEVVATPGHQLYHLFPITDNEGALAGTTGFRLPFLSGVAEVISQAFNMRSIKCLKAAIDNSILVSLVYFCHNPSDPSLNSQPCRYIG